MFIVGQNNPQVGDNRRKGLIDQLAQQLAQRFAQQNAQGAGFASDGARPFGLLNPALAQRRMRQQLLSTSNAMRPAGAGRDTSGTTLTNARPVPASVQRGLGVAVERTPARFLSPAPVGHVTPGGTMLSPMSPVPGASPMTPSTGFGHAITPGLQLGEPGQPVPALTSPVPGGLVPLGGGAYYNPATGTYMSATPMQPGPIHPGLQL